MLVIQVANEMVSAVKDNLETNLIRLCRNGKKLENKLLPN